MLRSASPFAGVLIEDERRTVLQACSTAGGKQPWQFKAWRRLSSVYPRCCLRLSSVRRLGVHVGAAEKAVHNVLKARGKRREDIPGGRVVQDDDPGDPGDQSSILSPRG